MAWWNGEVALGMQLGSVTEKMVRSARDRPYLCALQTATARK
jgi:hypothetical protein